MGSYQYLQDLLRLEQQQEGSAHQPQWMQGIITLLWVDTWAAYLQHHPNRASAEYIIQGLMYGFQLGCNRGVQQQRPRNLGSARQHPQEVDRYIAREVRLQHVICVPPGALGEIPTLRISPIGVIPKQSSLDKWRLIVHLSVPEGTSVNEGIEVSLCSIKYSSVDDAVRIIQQLGPGTMLAKLQ